MAKKERQAIVTLDYIKYLEKEFNEEHINYGLDYFSVYVNDLDSYQFKKLYKKYGFIVYGFFLEIHKQMLRGGAYYIPHFELEDFLGTFAYINKIDLDHLYQIYQDFLENKLIQFLDTTSIFGFSIITNSTVCFNYELTNGNRKQNREKARNRRSTNKTEKSEVPEEPEYIEDLEGSENFDNFEEPEDFSW